MCGLKIMSGLRQIYHPVYIYNARQRSNCYDMIKKKKPQPLGCGVNTCAGYHCNTWYCVGVYGVLQLKNHTEVYIVILSVLTRSHVLYYYVCLQSSLHSRKLNYYLLPDKILIPNFLFNNEFTKIQIFEFFDYT